MNLKIDSMNLQFLITEIMSRAREFRTFPGIILATVSLNPQQQSIRAGKKRVLTRIKQTAGFFLFSICLFFFLAKVRCSLHYDTHPGKMDFSHAA